MKDEGLWNPQERAWFEYHCHRGHDSADAPLWYRDWQQVTVLSVCRDTDAYRLHVDGATADERLEAALPLVYQVRFDDGLVWSVYEDELLADSDSFDSRLGPPPDWERLAADTLHLSQPIQCPQKKPL